MNLDIKIFLLCPIPEDQKPINQYINLKRNFFLTFFLCWPKFSLKIFFLTFFLFFQILTKSLSFNLYFFPIFTLFLFLNSICLQWIDLNKRFKAPRLIYEEASWYDGQLWEKPFILIKNDKLISSQKIEPILQGILRLIFTICFLLFNFLIFFELF
jgi:hypothetical protein